MRSKRRHDIDWLRVISIGLLLIYHIAIVFQPWAMLVGFIRSSEALEALWVPMSFLNIWRIPLLFFVSGMGVYFALRKRNWKQLILERSKRILLPFVFGVLAIVPLHIYLFQLYYNLPLAYTINSGHLWFLGNIFCYILLLTPLFLLLNKNRESYLVKRLCNFISHPLGLLLMSVFLVLEVLIVNPKVFSLYAQSLHGFFIGFVAFLLGYLFVFTGKPFWQSVLKWRWGYLVLAAGFYCMRVLVFGTNSPNYLMAIESFTWVVTLFGFAYANLNKPSKLLAYLNNAAYPIYIIHMFALYASLLLVLPLEIHLVLKFVLIIVLTSIICLTLYEFIIKRVPFFRPLFGLKISAKSSPDV